MYDLFLWGTPAAPLDKIDSAMNAGQDFIGNDLCNHYAFRQGTFDWQLWITTGDKLPRKLVITNRADEARPQSVTLIDWNLKPIFKDAVFKFTPPKGSTAVELRPLDKEMRHHHEKVIQQVIPGSPDRSRSGQLRLAPVAEARGGAEPGGGGGVRGCPARAGGGGGDRRECWRGGGGQIDMYQTDARANNVRSSSVNNVNSNRNTNINANRNVNVNVDNQGGCCGGGWDNDYHRSRGQSQSRGRSLSRQPSSARWCVPFRPTASRSTTAAWSISSAAVPGISRRAASTWCQPALLSIHEGSRCPRLPLNCRENSQG